MQFMEKMIECFIHIDSDVNTCKYKERHFFLLKERRIRSAKSYLIKNVDIRDSIRFNTTNLNSMNKN